MTCKKYYNVVSENDYYIIKINCHKIDNNTLIHETRGEWRKNKFDTESEANRCVDLILEYLK